MPGADDRLARVLASIDDANAAGPDHVVVDGVTRPKEVVHAERVTAWVHRLTSAPSPEQLVAARAHHLRRWALPRSDYPAGRAGYLRWRTEQKRRHASEVGDLLRGAGYDDAFAARVGDLIAKRGLGRDPEVQVHEDALCLSFLELQFDPVAAQLGDDRTVEVLRKTIAKMSPAAVDQAAALPLSDHGRQLLERAVAAAGPGDAGSASDHGA